MIIAPSFANSLAGAALSFGAKLPAAIVNQILGNHRLARMRPLLNWRRFPYAGAASGGARRVWYAGANRTTAGQASERPMWVSHNGQISGAEYIYGIRFDHSNPSTPFTLASGYQEHPGGILGNQYGTRRGLWTVRNGTANVGYWPSGTNCPLLNAKTTAGTVTPFASATFAIAGPSSAAASARLLVCCPNLFAASTDDGVTWATSTPAITPVMGAVSATHWVVASASKIYASTTLAGLTEVGSMPGGSGGVGVLYDPAYGRYHAWGANGYAWSNNGITWGTELAAPLGGADVRAMGASTDGVLVAATHEVMATTAGTALWGSFDGGSNWTLLTRFDGVVTSTTAGNGLIAYGAGQFALAADDGVFVCDRWAF